MPKYLNDITKEDLKLTEDLAALFFVPKEIAVMIELPWNEMKKAMDDEDSELYQAFQKGRLQSEVDLRKSIVKLAKSGSSPAQTMSMDMLQKSYLKMMNR